MIRHVKCTHIFFIDAATTEIYPLSLHDALPICGRPLTSSTIGVAQVSISLRATRHSSLPSRASIAARSCGRSEEHTSELQSRLHLVCRLLLEEKNLGCLLSRLFCPLPRCQVSRA